MKQIWPTVCKHGVPANDVSVTLGWPIVVCFISPLAVAAFPCFQNSLML